MWQPGPGTPCPCVFPPMVPASSAPHTAPAWPRPSQPTCSILRALSFLPWQGRGCAAGGRGLPCSCSVPGVLRGWGAAAEPSTGTRAPHSHRGSPQVTSLFGLGVQAPNAFPHLECSYPSQPGWPVTPCSQPTWALQRPRAAAPGSNALSKPICSQQVPPKCPDPLREAPYLAIPTSCQDPLLKAHVPSTRGPGGLPGCYPGGSG